MDEMGLHLINVQWVKDHVTMSRVGEGINALWQMQGNEIADTQAKEGVGSAPLRQKIEQNYLARSKFLGLVRGAEGGEAAPCAAWCGSSRAAKDTIPLAHGGESGGGFYLH